MIQSYSADPSTTVYFEEADYMDYGNCLIYTIPMPWDYPDTCQRALNYTLVYQKSTGYLVQYSVTGTEYCCGDTGTCVDFQLYCDDGVTAPLLVRT